MKKILLIVLGVLLFSFSVKNVQAASPSPLPTPKEINSYELFWPVVAGKTSTDPLYFLKIVKENLRGGLIFGKPQKVEYHVFIATKRILEAEKLINEGKTSEAEKAVESANVRLTKANDLLKSLKGEDLSSIADELNNKLDNLTIFLDYIQTKAEGGVLQKLQVSDGLVDQLSTNI